MSEMHDLVAPYLLGALEQAEHDAFEAHLITCEQCRKEVVDLEPGLEYLATTVAVEPPSELRSKILTSLDEYPAGRVAGEPRPVRAGWWGRIAIPAVAVLVLLVGSIVLFRDNPVDTIIKAPDATTVALATTDDYTGPEPLSARVVFSPLHEGAVVEIEGIVDPSGTNVYELWLIGANGPVPAGTFTPRSDGIIRVKLDGSAEAGLVVGITEEPAGGSPAPTGAVLFSAEL